MPRTQERQGKERSRHLCQRPASITQDRISGRKIKNEWMHKEIQSSKCKLKEKNNK